MTEREKARLNKMLQEYNNRYTQSKRCKANYTRTVIVKPEVDIEPPTRWQRLVNTIKAKIWDWLILLMCIVFLLTFGYYYLHGSGEMLARPYSPAMIDAIGGEQEQAVEDEEKEAVMPTVTWFGTLAKWIDQKGSAVALAHEIEKKYGVPAWLTLAQGIQESGGGEDGEVIAPFNYFGHKKHGGVGYEGRGRAGTVSGHQGYKSPWWGFHHHGYIVSTIYMPNRKGDSVRQWIDCLCGESNKIGKYDYAGACKGKDKSGNYRKGGYEAGLFDIIDRYKLMEL